MLIPQQALIAGKQLEGRYPSAYQTKPVKLTLRPVRLRFIKQAWYVIGKPNGGDTNQEQLHRTTSPLDDYRWPSLNLDLDKDVRAIGLEILYPSQDLEGDRK